GYGLVTDGIYGPDTEASVRAFQGTHGLLVDGKVGAATRTALQQEPVQEKQSILEQFIAYLWEQVTNHSVYVWGEKGQMKPTITEAWIRGRETSVENANRAIAYWKKQVAAGYGDVLRAFDCSGLGMYFFYNVKGILSSDMTANTMRKQ